MPARPPKKKQGYRKRLLLNRERARRKRNAINVDSSSHQQETACQSNENNFTTEPKLNEQASFQKIQTPEAFEEYVSSEKKLQLKEQMRMYVQLTAQLYLLSYGIPKLEHVCFSTKTRLETLKRFGEVGSTNNRESYFKAVNLDGALSIVDKYKISARNKKVKVSEKNSYTNEISLGVKKTLCESKVFMYPNLCPTNLDMQSFSGCRCQVNFTEAEDNLIAIGLANFTRSRNVAKDIARYLLPSRKERQIKGRINNSKLLNKSNPITYYLKHHELPEYSTKIRSFNTYNIKAPIKHPFSCLPIWMWRFREIYLENVENNKNSNEVSKKQNLLFPEKLPKKLCTSPTIITLKKEHLQQNVINLNPEVCDPTLVTVADPIQAFNVTEKRKSFCSLKDKAIAKQQVKKNIRKFPVLNDATETAVTYQKNLEAGEASTEKYILPHALLIESTGESIEKQDNNCFVRKMKNSEATNVGQSNKSSLSIIDVEKNRNNSNILTKKIVPLSEKVSNLPFIKTEICEYDNTLNEQTDVSNTQSSIESYKHLKTLCHMSRSECFRKRKMNDDAIRKQTSPLSENVSNRSIDRIYNNNYFLNDQSNMSPSNSETGKVVKLYYNSTSYRHIIVEGNADATKKCNMSLSNSETEKGVELCYNSTSNCHIKVEGNADATEKQSVCRSEHFTNIPYVKTEIFDNDDF